MKKFIVAVMAVAAIGFTSCGNKTQQAEEAVDSVALVDSLASSAAQEDIDVISGLLQGTDAAKLQEALETVKTKIATLVKENPEIAKEYVAKVQNYLKENAEQIKTLVGDNAAVAAAVSAVTEIEPESVVSGLLQQAGDAAEGVKDAAEEKVDEAKAAAEQKVDEAKAAAEQKVEDTKAAAKQKASDAIDNAAASAKSKLGL